MDNAKEKMRFCFHCAKCRKGEGAIDKENRIVLYIVYNLVFEKQLCIDF